MTIKYRDSGFYGFEVPNNPFFKRHTIDSYSKETSRSIKYDQELLAEHYKKDLGIEEYKDEADKRQQVHETFFENLSNDNNCFEPEFFDPPTALKCHLTPFKYKDKLLLASGGHGINLFPRFEAYQILTGSIDKRSDAFSVSDKARYFKNALLGDSVVQKVVEMVLELEKNKEIDKKEYKDEYER